MTINLLPVDENGNAIDAMRLRQGGAQKIAFNATSARQTTAFPVDRLVISVYATQDCFIRTGDSTVTATTNDHFIPSGFWARLALKGHTHIAVIRNSADGTLYISELE
jgi:hypothetical protein